MDDAIVSISLSLIAILFSAGLSLIGWGLRRALVETLSRLESLQEQVNRVSRDHLMDQSHLHEKFVSKEEFQNHIGRNEGLVGKMFDELRGLTATLNQTIGEIKCLKEKNPNA